jgi:SulP family sulfate permease
MLGFVNGLAIVIFLAQFEQFKVTGIDGAKTWITGLPLAWMIGLVALTMVVIHVVPKFTRLVPAPLAAILVVAAIVIGFDIPVPRVGDMASIAGTFPEFSIPSVPLTLETLHVILPYAAIFAAIGLIESLLTLNLVGEKTGTRGGSSQECLAQGAANVVTGFFGGMGGCAMIGQSMINVESGARTRISGLSAAVLLLSFILFASALIEEIPLAALIGVMFMVVIGTFAWKSFAIIARVPRVDAAVIVLVTIITVLTDLAVAVVAGVVISALAYAWSNATRIRATIEDGNGTKVYRIEGPLFFGSAAGFQELFTPRDDPDRVVVDFKGSRVADQSALQAIETLAEKYDAVGTRLELLHLSRDCHALLAHAGQLMVDSDDDPDYGVAVHYGVRIGRFGDAH